jgi:nitrogen regulatory protein PII
MYRKGNNIVINRIQKLITCILPKGISKDVVKQLKTEKGILTANINNARGVGKITPLAYRGIIGSQSEKEILTVVVPVDQADELFEYIYDKANINRPHGGLMYMHALPKSTRFTLPDIPDEG